MSEMITTPVGRLVEGNLYRGSEFDINNQPKVFKKGKNAGQTRVDFYFALAIPKGHESHWNQTEWGQTIEKVARAAFPAGQWQRPDFAWKIIDGDSSVLNGNQRRPCDKEGFKGNWVLKFSRPFAPKIYNADGSKQLTEENYINLGDFIQVHAGITGNQPSQQPGIYMNHFMVAFSGYGERIVQGSDAKSVGFGNAPLPPGASAAPLATFTPPVVSAAPNVAPPPASPAPYPQILNVPAAPVRTMLAAANGLTYEQYKNAGWTDEQMIQGGLMIN